MPTTPKRLAAVIGGGPPGRCLAELGRAAERPPAQLGTARRGTVTARRGPRSTQRGRSRGYGVMTYVTLAGLVVLLMFALVQWVGRLRRTLFQGRRSYRHGGDSDWECSSQRRVRLRRQ